MPDVIQTLRSVPGFKPKIIDLTWQLVDKDGNLDMKKAAENTTIEAALAEADNYAREVGLAVGALRSLTR